MSIEDTETPSEIRFTIESLHPRIDSETLLQRAIDLTPLLEKQLSGSLADVTIEADRRQSIPLTPEIAILIYKLAPKAAAATPFILKSVSGGILAAIGKDIYDFLRSKLTNVTIRPQAPPPSS